MTRSAFSLLEVLTALAILLLGLAALMRLTEMAGRGSLESEELAVVQLAVQAKLNELLASGKPIGPVRDEAIAGVRNWSLSVELQPVSRPGVTAVCLLARKQERDRYVARYELVRWVTDDRVSADRPEATVPSLLPIP